MMELIESEIGPGSSHMATTVRERVLRSLKDQPKVVQVFAASHFSSFEKNVPIDNVCVMTEKGGIWIGSHGCLVDVNGRSEAMKEVKKMKYIELPAHALVTNWSLFPSFPIHPLLKEWINTICIPDQSTFTELRIPVRYFSMDTCDRIFRNAEKELDPADVIRINDRTFFKNYLLPKVHDKIWIIENCNSLRKKTGPPPGWRRILRRVVRNQEKVRAKELWVCVKNIEQARQMLENRE